jgi:thiol-disulfide isomerase/thioredoxin
MHTWLAFALMTLMVQQPNAETKIVDYLRDSIEQGRLVEVSELVNDVFTTPEERAALGRLYDTFFKIPLFLVQYQNSAGEPPTLRQIADQYVFNGPETANVILNLMAADPRLPRFFERDASGEITSISVQPVLDHPQFGQAIERSITGWEGRQIPDFVTETFDGSPFTSDDIAGTPHMVYVWFSNCPPCLQTGPLLVELFDEYKDTGFEIMAANADKFLELPYDDQVRSDYVNRLGMDFTLAHLTSEMHEAYGGVSIFPTMFFVDRDGTVLRHFVNFQEKEILAEAIEATLE